MRVTEAPGEGLRVSLESRLIHQDKEKASRKWAWYWKADRCVLVWKSNSRNYFADSLDLNQHAAADP